MTQEPAEISPYPDRSVETNRDVAHQYMTHLADLLPGLGAIVERHIVPPLQRRRIAWLNLVGATLNQHTAALTTLETNTVKQDEFLTLFIRASQGAMATHESEKHAMFSRALDNALLSPSDFDTHIFFISLLDQFQVLHVKILAQFREPAPLIYSVYSPSDSKGRTSRVDELVFMGAGDSLKLPTRFAVRLLANTELIDLESTQTIENPQMELTGSITTLGDQFLRFVTK